jgi:predicted RND superfamily exporter protein
MNQFFPTLIKYPKVTLLLCFLLTAILGVGATKFQNTLDFRFFFSEDNPQLLAYERLQSSYGSEEFIFIAIEALDGELFTRRNLEALQELTESAWLVPYSLRVDSLTNFQYSLSGSEELQIQDLFSRELDLDEEQLRIRKLFALSEPATVNALISADNRVAGMRVMVKLPGLDRSAETPEVVFFIRKMVADFEQKYPQFKLHMSGQIVVDQAFPEATEADMAFVWPAFFVVMLVVLGAIFRSVIFVLITLVTAICVIASGMGLLGWTGMKINAAVTVAPVMILTLAIADCIHLLTHYKAQRRQGLNVDQSIMDSLKSNRWPVFITSILTAGGFLTLHFNDSPPYQALGYIVCAGVVFAWLYAVTLLPALVKLLPHTIVQAPSHHVAPNMFYRRLADWIVDHSKSVLVASSVMIVFLLGCLPLNRINDDPVKYFGAEQQMRKYMEFINDNITGQGALNYSVPIFEGGSVTDPVYLALLDDFSSWLKQQPQVVHVDSLADIIKRLNQSWYTDDTDFYRLPESREAASQLLLLYELSLPFGADLGNLIAPNREASRVRITMSNTAGDYHIALDDDANAWLQARLGDAYPGGGASAPLMFAHIGERSMKGILVGLVGSLFIMGLILVGVMRSLRLGLVSMLGNLIPVAMAFGLWGLINGDIDVGLSVTLGIAFGIVVDDTIHLLTNFHRAQREGFSTADAIRSAFTLVGPALVTTTVVLICGFAMLGFSEMNLTANTSILTTITIAVALLVDLFFIPALLITLDPKSREHSKHGQRFSP